MHCQGWDCCWQGSWHLHRPQWSVSFIWGGDGLETACSGPPSPHSVLNRSKAEVLLPLCLDISPSALSSVRCSSTEGPRDEAEFLVCLSLAYSRCWDTLLLLLPTTPVLFFLLPDRGQVVNQSCAADRRWKAGFRASLCLCTNHEQKRGASCRMAVPALSSAEVTPRTPGLVLLRSFGLRIWGTV